MSPRDKGPRFERQVADYLARTVDDRVDRRVRNGAKDKGDIAGVRCHGQRVVIECKNTTRPVLAQALAEAEVERGNDDALAGIVAHKRHGKGADAEQLVTMRLIDLAALLTGVRPDLSEETE